MVCPFKVSADNSPDLFLGQDFMALCSRPAYPVWPRYGGGCNGLSNQPGCQLRRRLDGGRSRPARASLATLWLGPPQEIPLGDWWVMCWVILVAKSWLCQVRVLEHRQSFRQLGWLGGNHSDDRASKLFPTLRGKRSKQHQALLKPSRLPSYIPRR